MNIFDVLVQVFTSATNGWIYLGKDIGGVKSDGRISVTNLLKPVTDEITLIKQKTDILPITEVIENQTSDFELVMPANSLLVSGIVLVPIASTPVIKIGTTLGGDDVLPEQTQSSRQLVFNPQYNENETTLYFSISTGTGTLTIKYIIHEDFI